MQIEFKKLIIHNFMSFKDIELSFNNSGYILVTGQNNYKDDNSYSNGSGKSALWEAISWVLTGNTIRGFKDIVNKDCEDGAFVEIFFSCDDKEYHLIRSKNSAIYKTNLFIYIDGEDKSSKGIRDSEKTLKELFPDLTSQLIGSVIILGQGLPQRFTNNTPSGRKDILEKLTKSDFMIEDLKYKVNKREADLKSTLRGYEDKRLSIETQINDKKNSNLIIKSKLDNLEKTRLKANTLAQLESELKCYQDKLFDQEAINSQKSKIDSLNIDINSILSDTQIRKKEFEIALKDAKSDLEIQKATLQSEIVSLNKKILEIQSIKTICPTCKQKLEGVEKPDPTPFIEEKSNKSKLLDSINNEITNISKTYDSEIAQNQINCDLQIKNLRSVLISEQQIYSDMISNNEVNNSRIKNLTDEISNISNTLLTIDNQVKILSDTIIENDNCISDLSEKLLYINNSIEDTNQRLSIISKMQTALKRDFRGILLQNIINYLDTKCKEYCNIVFNTENIEFRLNGNDISISYNNKEYECLSGGEKQRLDIMIQLAIRDLLCDYLNFSSNILVVDEVFDNLDLIGCNQIINLLSTKINDVSSIYVITHRGAELDIPNDHQITIIKDELGTSRLNEF